MFEKLTDNFNDIIDRIVTAAVYIIYVLIVIFLYYHLYLCITD